ITLERALAGHRHAGHFAEAAEILEQRAIGQAGSEAAVFLLEQHPGDVAAQGTAAVELTVLLSLGSGLFAAADPALEILSDQEAFQSAQAQQLIDAQELSAQEPVIDIALDGGQDLRQERFKRNNGGVRHKARVSSSL